MTQKEILLKIDLDELLKTEFNDMITIKYFKKGYSIFYKQLENFRLFDVDINFEEDSIIAYLPFEKNYRLRI